MNKYLLLFLVIITITSCSNPIEINDFDSKIWLNDIDGCKKERNALAEVLIKNKDKLLGKDQDQITNLLGKPDKHEIYRRSQRFYIYSVSPGSSCSNYVADNTASILSLRFNAMGRVHEVVYYK